MKHTCPACGKDFEVGANTLPCCPHCVKQKMLHPGGLSNKHTLSGAMASTSYASYIGDGIDPEKIFDYLAGGAQTGPSGCELFYSTTHRSWNAVSYKPLGDIPGSGTGPSGPHAAEFAVLVDIEGNSNQGPHWMFEHSASLQNRRVRGEWTIGYKCIKCGLVWVLNSGDTCPNCQSAGGSTKP